MFTGYEKPDMIKPLLQTNDKLKEFDDKILISNSKKYSTDTFTLLDSKTIFTEIKQESKTLYSYQINGKGSKKTVRRFIFPSNPKKR